MGDAEKEKSAEGTEAQADANKDKDGDDAMNVDTSPTTATAIKNPSIPHSKAARAAHLALSASARAAHQLATAEENSIRNAISELIKLTLTKLELKMAQFEEMEELLEEERRSLESQRMALSAERMGLRKAIETVRAEVAKNTTGASGSVTPAMSMMGGGPGVSAAIGAAATVLSAGQGAKVSEVTDKTLTGDSGPSVEGSFTALG